MGRRNFDKVLETRGRELLAAALFVLVGGLLLAIERSYGQLPSLVWLGLLALGAMAWVASLGPVPQIQSEPQPRSETENAPSLAMTAVPSGQETNPPETEVDLMDVRVLPPPSGAALVLSSVAHEIRTPLNAIVGFSELMRDAERSGADAKSRQEFASHVLENARQLQTIFDTILEANRLQTGTANLVEQDCDIGEILEAATRDNTEQAEAHGIAVIVHVAAGIGVRGDPNRLRRALAGLLRNAITHSPPDGLVNARMVRAEGDGLIITITDAGAGIAAKDIERALQPFSQVDEGLARQFGGLGLGLYVSREIARLHDGDLEVVSEPGVGTEVRFTLPARRLAWPAGSAADMRRVA